MTKTDTKIEEVKFEEVMPEESEETLSQKADSLQRALQEQLGKIKFIHDIQAKKEQERERQAIIQENQNKQEQFEDMIVEGLRPVVAMLKKEFGDLIGDTDFLFYLFAAFMMYPKDQLWNKTQFINNMPGSQLRYLLSGYKRINGQNSINGINGINATSAINKK